MHSNRQKHEPVRLPKDSSRSRLSGGIFELRTAGLVNARLCALRRRRPDLNLRFHLATNVDGANPFDDVVLRMRWRQDGRDRKVTYFVQLKHAEKADKPVSAHELTAPEAKRKNDFKLTKYFKFYQLLTAPNADVLPNKEDKNTYEKIKKLYQKFQETDEQFTERENERVEWVKNECLFVLFTSREVLPNWKCKRESQPLDFPFHEVFQTDRGVAFCFGKADSDVWNMFEGTSEQELFRKEFLPRLLICSAQAQVHALEPLLARALEDVLGGSSPRCHWMLARYSDFLLRWWDSDDGDCLSEHNTEIEAICREDIHRNLHNLRFRSNYQDALQQRLRECRFSYIVVPGIPTYLRCSLIWSVLDKISPGRFVILTNDVFQDYSIDSLDSICFRLAEEVVFCADYVDERMKQLLKRMLDDKRRNVRIVSNQWDDDLYKWMQSEMEGPSTPLCGAWSEIWAMAHLEDSEQSRLLQREVSFQGHVMRLSELQKAWPSMRQGVRDTALGALAAGDCPPLGAPLLEPEPYFVNRTLEHRSVLRDSVWEISSAQDVFMLRGFPEEKLEELRSPHSLWTECLFSEASNGVCSTMKNLSTGQLPQTKWMVWNDIKMSHTPFEIHTNVHRLSYENHSIVWYETKGDSLILHEHVIKKCNRCEMKPICSHKYVRDFLRWTDRTLYLSAHAGAGKSTFLTNVAHNIKIEDPSHWVFVIRMGDGNAMDNFPSNITLTEISNVLKDFCVNSLSYSALHLLKECVQKSGYVTVLIDGVDEVCPVHKEKSLRIIHLLRDVLLKTGGRLWVAARTVLEEDLSKTLHCGTPLLLRPFSPRQQCRYLKSLWNRRLQELDKEESKKIVKTFVDVIRKDTQGSDTSLCDVPLYTRLVAEVYEEKDLEEILRTRVQRIALYRKFVQKMTNCMWSKIGITESDIINFNVMSSVILQKHSVFGALVCFSNTNNLGQHYDSILESTQKLKTFDRERLAKIGFITHFIQGKPVFLHHTLAEYFAAAWMTDKYDSLPDLMRVMFEGSEREQYADLRYFFDALLAEGHALHEAALSGRTEDVEGALRRDAQLLHEEDAGGRTALHLAAIYGHHDVAQFLLEYGADAMARDHVMSWTPLEYVANRLADDSERPNIDVSRLAIVEQLLRRGVEPMKHLGIWREPWLTEAVVNDFHKIVEVVMSGDAAVIFFDSYSAHAATLGSVNVLALLLELGRIANLPPQTYFPGNSLLCEAARGGSAESCGLILQYGCSVSSSYAADRIPLLYSALNGHQSVCRLLIERGALVNSADYSGSTALHLAVEGGQEEISRYLIDEGANVNARNSVGMSPLHVVVGRSCNGYQTQYGEFGTVKELSFMTKRNSYETVCRLLVDAGAHVNAQDANGETVLHWLAREPTEPLSLQMFLRNEYENTEKNDGTECSDEPDSDETVDSYETDHSVDTNMGYETDDDATDDYDETDSSFSSDDTNNLREFSMRLCQLFLDRGTDPRLLNFEGKTAYDIACFSKRSDIANILRLD